MRVPVRPPASPVATTGWSSRFSARATLIPFPPASVTTSLARWRCPSWRIGTVSERSSAALRVTVTITGRVSSSGYEAGEMMERSTCHEARLGERSRLRDIAVGDQRRAGDEARAVEDANLTQPLSPRDGEREHTGHDDALDERPEHGGGPHDRTRGAKADARQAPARVGTRVHASRVDGEHRAVLAEPPSEEGLEVGVAGVLGRCAEDGNGDRRASIAGRCYLRPPGVGGVPGLGPEEAGEHGE